MKNIIPLFTFTFGLHLSLLAAVPVPWTVDMRRAQPATFEAYQGETLDFKASLTLDGKPFEAPSNYSFFWQTNGMGNAFWSVPCPSSATTTNVLFATWSPTNDVGARVYNCFIGQPGTIYHAAFQLRLRPSPGADPNTLPLPVPVIDFAKVRVLNPPWEGGGGGGGVNTNAVRDIVREQLATNGIRSVDGAARPLPKYLHLYDADDSYPDAAQEYYRSRGNGKVDGGCSSVRDGGYLYRNFDFPFDSRSEFIVRMSAGKGRLASVGVAQVGTNLTEQMVTSGKPEYSRLYKWLPGATVDGINECGVACNINVADGDPQISGWHNDTGDLHPLAAIRHILDNATNAQSAAEYIAAHIAFPARWEQNFHYMIADTEKTFIVSDGSASLVRWDSPREPVLTNFRLGKSGREGYERFEILSRHENITNTWYTLAYSTRTSPPWMGDFYDSDLLYEAATNMWASAPKEAHRGETYTPPPPSLTYTWWQTVHTSIYDITNRTLRVAVQEQDDWYVFQVPSSGCKGDTYTKAEVDELLDGKANTEDIPTSVMQFDDFDSEVDNAMGKRGISQNEIAILGPISGTEVSVDGHTLSDKANRPSDPVAGNIAVLDEYGDLVDGGKKAELVVTMIDPSSPEPIVGDISINGAVDSATMSANTIVAYEGFSDSKGDLREGIDAKADRSMINHTNETFSNEVATVARTVQPAPSPTLRLFDPVLNRWVILKSVNMNLTLEVE